MKTETCRTVDQRHQGTEATRAYYSGFIAEGCSDRSNQEVEISRWCRIKVTSENLTDKLGSSPGGGGRERERDVRDVNKSQGLNEEMQGENKEARF